MSLGTIVVLLSLINLVFSQFHFNNRYRSIRASYLNRGLKVTRTADDDIYYRLPTSLDPIHYDIEITPYFEAENGKEAFTFDGIVTIVVKVKDENICEIVIHEKVLEILEVKVIDNNGDSLNLDQAKPFERIKKYNFLRINLDENNILVKNACYNITVRYTGIIGEDEEEGGLFRDYYKNDNGNIHWYASCNFQPVYTRQAFPCFDEPGFKSTFSIIVNRPPTFAPTYSNMKLAEEIPCEDRIKEIFHVTPRMSAYLVLIHISEDFKVIADNNNATHPFRVIARINAAGQGDYAMEVGTKAIACLIDYLGIDSYTMAENMNEDHIALLRLSFAGVESWGSIIYSEDYFLTVDGEDNEWLVALTVAHEIAHKWFGNLVTCHWWSDSWLNEGFAVYLENLVFNMVHGASFHSMWIVTKEAFIADSDEHSQPLQRTVNRPDEAQMSLDFIVYVKAGSLLIMVRDLVTEGVFRKALNTYLIENAYENAKPEDVYNAFACILHDKTLPSDLDIKTFMKPWVEESGHPLIDVKINPETGVISLRQERFLMNPSAEPSEQVWPVPLTFTTGADPDWDNLTPSHVMTDKSLDIQGTPGQHWVIFNIQQRGLYRVNYDTSNWQKIIQTLENNPDCIHELNRAQIVSDVFALMVSRKLTFEFGFQIVNFLKQETSFYVWHSAKDGFDMFLDHFFHLSDAQVEFKRIIQSLLDAVVNLGLDGNQNESPIIKPFQNEILNFACIIGNERCVKDAVAKFTALKNSASSLLPDIYVYCMGVHEGDYDDWVFLKQLRERPFITYRINGILEALACTQNEQALQEYLELLVTEREKYLFIEQISFILKHNDAHSTTVLQFIKQKIDDIRKSPVDIEYLFYVLATHLKQEHLNDMEQWLLENKASIPEYAEGIEDIKEARSKLQQGWPDADRILTAARGAGTHGVPTLTSLLKSFVSTGVSMLAGIYNNLHFQLVE